MAPKKTVAMLVTAVCVMAVVTAGAVVVALRAHAPDTASSAAAPGATEAPGLSEDEARAQTCDTLKAGLPPLVGAIQADKRLGPSASWSSPETLNAANSLVYESGQLADTLETSLTPSTPHDLRVAVTEYVVALRALAITYRDHASDKQLGGVAVFYNQLRHAPLRLCGMEDE